MKEKPKILFIIPPCSEHDHNWGKTETEKKKKELRTYPYLGVCYLIAGLEKDKRLDYEIRLIDSPAENLTLNELIKKVEEEKPTIIAVSMTTFALRVSYLFIKACREKVPSAKIILGGVHINHSPQDLKYFEVDYGLRGDCEFTIKELIEGVLEGKGVKKIQGIVYKNKESGELVITEPAVITDLDSIPFPDRTRLNPSNYLYPIFDKKFTTIISSRGCPYKCVYCGLPYNRQHKTRSAQNVIDELKIIEKQGFEYASFSDDIFTMVRSRVVEICQKIKEEGIKLKWGCSTRVDQVDLELLKLIKNSGCIDIRYGVESGNERVRNTIINKGVSDEQIRNAVNWAKKAGLMVTGFFLFGQPTETLEEMKETIEFAKKTNFDFANFSIVVPIPHSGTFLKAIEEGKIKTTIWREVIEGKSEIPFYYPEGVSIEDMQKLRTHANRSFYLRPRYIFNQILSIKSFKDFRLRFKSGINLIMYRGKD